VGLVKEIVLGISIGLFSALLIFIIIGYFRIALYYEIDFISLVRFVIIGAP